MNGTLYFKKQFFALVGRKLNFEGPKSEVGLPLKTKTFIILKTWVSYAYFGAEIT